MNPLFSLIEIARRGGDAILAHYGSDPGTVLKGDDSPLTLADLASHRVICQDLAERFPEIPICSEEGMENGEVDPCGRYWLVDPLDGTKEFLKKTGSFTVNIALIESGQPTCGVICVPATGVCYYGGVGLGAFVLNSETALASAVGGRVPRPQSPESEMTWDKPSHVVPGPRPIHVSAVPAVPRFVASRDHAGPEVKQMLESFEGAECLSIGSSLKFCLVAEGRADAYLRDVPTMEWDTAAAHAILHAAGGHLLTWPELKPLTYGKPEWRNPSLLTVGDPNLATQIKTKLA